MATTTNFGGTLPTDSADDDVWGVINNTLHELWDDKIAEIGEFQSAELASGSATSLSTGVAKNVTSLSLSEGDRDVWGEIGVSQNGVPSFSVISGWISTTSATNPGGPNGGAFFKDYPGTNTATHDRPVGRRRLSLGATTTVYLSVLAEASTGSISAYGGLYARRAKAST